MKRKKLLLISSVMFVAGAVALAASLQLCFKQAVKHRAVEAPRNAFKTADRFEILFIEETSTDDAAETFSVSPFRDTYRVTHSVKISGSQALEFRRLITSHFLTTEFSAMCHTPHHAIRAFNGSRLTLEATLCLECINMEFAAFGLIPTEVTIMEKDNSGLSLPLLENFLSKQIKAPQFSPTR